MKWYKVRVTITAVIEVLATNEETAKEIALYLVGADEIEEDGYSILKVDRKVEVIEEF